MWFTYLGLVLFLLSCGLRPAVKDRSGVRNSATSAVSNDVEAKKSGSPDASRNNKDQIKDKKKPPLKQSIYDWDGVLDLESTRVQITRLD